MADRIIIEIDGDTGELLKTFRKVEDKAGKAGQGVGDSFGDGVTKGFKASTVALGAGLAALGAAVSAAFAVKAGVETAAQFEQINTQLQVLTGSAETANKVFEELKQFSAETPFQLKDIAQASAKLISFGFSAGEVKNRLKEIGEVAAGSGSNLQEIALIFGQVAAAGKLTGERLLQLQERAIPIGPAIAQTLGIAESKVRDFVSQGKVTADVFQAAFKSMSNEGGIFAGALAKQSQTINGSLSTLKDNFELLKGEFGKAFGPAIVKAAQGLSKAFQEVSEKFKDPEFQRSVGIFASAMANAVIFVAKLGAKLVSSVGPGLDEITKRAAHVEEQLGFAQKRLASLQGSTIGKLFGGFDQATDDVKKFTAELADLEARRIALINQAPNLIQSLKDVSEVENEISRQRALEAERQKAEQEAALVALGTIGLSKTQILEEQLARDLALIQAAETSKALSEDQANARRIESLEAVNTQIKALQDASKKAEKGIDKTAANIGKSMNQALGNGVANGIQTVTKALIDGQNVFKAFGQAVLGLVADMAIQMGKIFVATGIAQLALFATPGASILAGAALIAAGTIAKSIFGGGGSSSVGGAPSGGGVASSGNFAVDSGTENPATAQVQEREQPSTTVQVTVQGDILDSDETGIRLVNILNDAFEKDGVVIRNGAVA